MARRKKRKETLTTTELPPVTLKAPTPSPAPTPSRKFSKKGTLGAVMKGGGVITINGRDFVVTPTQRAIIEKIEGIDKFAPQEERKKIPEGFDIEQAKADIRGVGLEQEEVPEGRAGTDIQREKGLREKGLITVQTGVDETGSPLTQIVSFDEFKRLEREKGTSEADALVEFLSLGAIASPSGVVGGIPSATKIIKPPLKVGKGKTATNILKGNLKKAGIKILEKDRQIKTIKRNFKVDRASAEKLYNLYQVTTIEKITTFMTNPKTWKWAVGGLLGTSLMTAWLASDNVLSSSAFTMIKLREAVESEDMSKAEALDEADEIQTWIDIGRSVVNIMTRINPFLWPSRGTYMVNADKAQADYDLELRRILLFEAEGR